MAEADKARDRVHAEKFGVLSKTERIHLVPLLCKVAASEADGPADHRQVAPRLAAHHPSRWLGHAMQSDVPQQRPPSATVAT